MKKKKYEINMKERTELFKAITEPNRVRILLMLMQKSLCVCEITSILELTNATVSSHLSFLKEKGLIKDDKDGKWTNYSIVENSDDSVVQNIIELLPLWFAGEKVIIEDLIKVQTVDRHVICNTSLNKDNNRFSQINQELIV